MKLGSTETDVEPNYTKKKTKTPWTNYKETSEVNMFYFDVFVCMVTLVMLQSEHETEKYGPVQSVVKQAS